MVRAVPVQLLQFLLFPGEERTRTTSFHEIYGNVYDVIEWHAEVCRYWCRRSPEHELRLVSFQNIPTCNRHKVRRTAIATAVVYAANLSNPNRKLEPVLTNEFTHEWPPHLQTL